MTHPDTHILNRLEAIARPMAVITILIVFATIFHRHTQNTKDEVLAGASTAQVHRTDDAIAGLEAQLKRRQTQLNAVSTDIAKQIEERNQLHLTMADVLSRAKMLEQQRTRISQVQQEVKRIIEKMDKDYERAGATGVNVDSR